MAQYKVKKTLEVEFRVEAMLIFNGFLNPNSIPTLEIRRSEVLLEDN